MSASDTIVSLCTFLDKLERSFKETIVALSILNVEGCTKIIINISYYHKFKILNLSVSLKIDIICQLKIIFIFYKNICFWW